ncbi:ribonuclease H1 domain-containing protein [Lagierella massiliensis]|uniref:ribonuclease H1 domain-containing protein n=1 Tax=Lagierella massiliensis TaxID=1689303 RepID=UPI0006D8172C|nr:ribonuclease H family protein [Lagierella massiliensis]
MAGNNFYAVKVGRNPGVYRTWDECKRETAGFSGAIYKKFKTKAEAENFINGEKSLNREVEHHDVFDDELVVYVDGSYNVKTNVCGYGVVFLLKHEVKEHFGRVQRPEYAQYRNVTGEIYATIYAIKKAIEMGFKKIHIHYDYAGISAWALGNWKTNNELTSSYSREFSSLKKNIDVKFIKVESHTGVKYNELADKLAKKGAGVQ